MGAPQMRFWFVFVLDAIICTTEIVSRVYSTLPKKKKIVFWHAASHYLYLPPKHQPLFVSKCFLRHIIGKCASFQLSSHLCVVSPVSEASQLVSSTNRQCDGLTSCYVMATDQTNQFMGTMLIILAAQARYSRMAARELKLPVGEDRETENLNVRAPQMAGVLAPYNKPPGPELVIISDQ